MLYYYEVEKNHNEEIERKFLVKIMPDISHIKPVHYERYFIFKDNETEIRIQKKDSKYELERKIIENNLSAKKYKIDLTEKEFEKFKEISSDSINRESYHISDNPNISLKIYQGRFKGLIRVEVEFLNQKDAYNFVPLLWFGPEITDSLLAKDSNLLDLTNNEFKNILENEQNSQKHTS